jgi:hypothetical protein
MNSKNVCFLSLARGMDMKSGSVSTMATARVSLADDPARVSGGVASC